MDRIILTTAGTIHTPIPAGTAQGIIVLIIPGVPGTGGDIIAGIAGIVGK